MVGVARHYQLGWWPQNGRLDALDARLSLPLLRLELGRLEYVLAVPGTWFGMPAAAWILLPMLVGASAAEEGSPRALWLLAVCAPIAALTLALFVRAVRTLQTLRELYLGTKFLIVPVVVAPAMLAHLVLGPRAAHGVRLALLSWLFAEMVSQVVKITARRMRPAVALADELAKTRRELLPLRNMGCESMNAFASFPSGDVCGAGAFGALFYAYTGGSAWCFALPFLSGLGRVYFHAHHVIDVLVGGALGWSVANKVVSHAGLDGTEDDAIGELHVAAAMALFILLHVVSHRVLGFEVPAEFKTAKRTIM